MLLSPPDSPCDTFLDSQVEDHIKFDMEAFSQQEPIPLQPRFAEIKRKIVAANEDAIAASWNRLLRELKREIDLISTMNAAEVIPAIDFRDATNASAAEQRENFASQLKKRGVGIIRGVVPKETALSWKQDLDDYIWTNPQTRTSTCGSLPKEHAVYKLFWSPAQIKARAHPNILAAQRFAMSHWSTPSPRSPRTGSSSSISTPLVATSSPITYADRIVVPIRDPWMPHSTLNSSTAQVDNGSVERWEADGYGRARTYSYILEGWWEGHDPWDASARASASPDLYGGGGRCSIFRMFQGWLSLGQPNADSNPLSSTAPTTPGDGAGAGAGLAILPLLKHTTAYFLLRPFFSPSGQALYTNSPDLSPQAKWEAFLSESNWTLIPAGKQDSILHGALPSYAQEINNLLHPHLRLGESLVPVPSLEAGDYLVWHPDLVHTATPGDGSAMVCLPAVPLTQGNALYLAQQRRAFLKGGTGPDFASGGRESFAGENGFVGRAGMEDVRLAGGGEGLRATGLEPWDVDGEPEDEMDREARRMGNGILFPDFGSGVDGVAR